MTIGKLYYLANVFGGIEEFLMVVCVLIGLVLVALTVFALITVFDDYCDDDDIAPIKKYLKIASLVFLVTGFLSILIPSKEDFLIIALTKDYKAEQVYKMSKEELKSGIDYAIERLKEVKNED